MLAALKPGLHGALLAAKAAGYSHVIVDGTLIHTDRISTPGPTEGVDRISQGLPPKTTTSGLQRLTRVATPYTKPPGRDARPTEPAGPPCHGLDNHVTPAPPGCSRPGAGREGPLRSRFSKPPRTRTGVVDRGLHDHLLDFAVAPRQHRPTSWSAAVCASSRRPRVRPPRSTRAPARPCAPTLCLRTFYSVVPTREDMIAVGGRSVRLGRWKRIGVETTRPRSPPRGGRGR